MRKLPTVLTHDESEALLRQPNLKATTGLRNRAILETMLYAGLRVSEVTNLRPRDIRWKEHRLEVRGGKGGKDRSIPLTPGLAAMLERWKEHRPESEWFFCTGCERGGIASGSSVGSQLSDRYVQQAVKRYATKAGVDRSVSPHTLRHTAATTWLDKGFTIREVQSLLGHSDVSTTMIYTHVNDEVLSEKMAAL